MSRIWQFLSALFLLVGCTVEKPPPQTTSCPLRPTTEAKSYELIGESWTVISVIYPLDARIECVGDNGADFRRVVSKMTQILKNRELEPNEFYGVGPRDCVCEGKHGYSAVMMRNIAVVTCLTPEEALAVRERHVLLTNR
ncbi:MAG: hypothetical protein WCT54_02315 [Patescibacteria group bacterium]|jgi:hypothetical protein